MTPGLPKPLAPTHVPTLTEVIERRDAEERVLLEASRGSTAPVLHTSADALHAEITQRVLADLQPRLQLDLERRVHDLLAPAFARVAESLANDLHAATAGALVDLVGRAVADELSRRKTA